MDNTCVAVEYHNTIMAERLSLFVKGMGSPDELMNTADNEECDVIHFGADNSFSPKSVDEWLLWEDMIRTILKTNQYYCVLEIGIEHVMDFHESGLTEFNNFVLIINADIPYIGLLGYNTTLNITGKNNPGSWGHSIQDMTSPATYTHQGI